VGWLFFVTRVAITMRVLDADEPANTPADLFSQL
jgi:hypothetical protein